jgi:hypothetical protein
MKERVGLRHIVLFFSLFFFWVVRLIMLGVGLLPV